MISAEQLKRVTLKAGPWLFALIWFVLGSALLLHMQGDRNRRSVAVATQPAVEHKTRYYPKGAEYGIICIHADSTWQGDFIVYCTAGIEEALDLTVKLNDMEKAVGSPAKKTK